MNAVVEENRPRSSLAMGNSVQTARKSNAYRRKMSVLVSFKDTEATNLALAKGKNELVTCIISVSEQSEFPLPKVATAMVLPLKDKILCSINFQSTSHSSKEILGWNGLVL